MTDQPPIASREAVQAALTALGLTGAGDDASLAFLWGSLLALAEAAFWQDLDRSDVAAGHEGYISTLVAFSGGDLDDAGKWWMTLLTDRINRTGIEIWEGVEPGEGKGFLNVAGPAMYAASNVIAMTNAPLDEERARKSLDSADDNLKKARKNLAALRTMLRQHGMKI